LKSGDVVVGLLPGAAETKVRPAVVIASRPFGRSLACPRRGGLLRLTQRLMQHRLDIRLVRQALLSCLLARQLDIILR
jgi:hypothetical protein